MFALIPLDKWEAGEGSISLKCDPQYTLELREQYDSIEAAFHMNKTHWNTIYVYKGEVLPELLFQLIDHSFNEVVKGMTKKKQQALKE